MTESTNYYRRHIPGFIEIDEDIKDIPFNNTTEDLLNLEVVKRCKEYKDFSHFELANNCLMVILKNKKFYVEGYIKDISNIDIPKWDPVKYGT